MLLALIECLPHCRLCALAWARPALADGVTSEVADSKIGAQWSLDKKRAMADIVIDNNGTLPELHEKLDAWMAAHAERQTRHWWQQWVPTVPTLLLVAVATPLILSLTALSRWIAG